MNCYLRKADLTDSEGILNVYAPYIKDTAITFETVIPAVDEFTTRVANFIKQYPYLVACADGKVVGYAYASRHRERAAYCYDADVSIYTMPEYHGKGVAVYLYNVLFTLLKELGYINLYAGYTVPNVKSMKFHQKFGFVYVGTYHNTGYKFNKWHDVAWMEKSINAHVLNPEPVKMISSITDEHFMEIITQYSSEKNVPMI